jgi:hypothetical protein
MADIVELEFEGGTMEIAVTPGEAASRGFGDEVVRVRQTFDAALSGLRGFGDGVHNTLSQMVGPPTDVTVEFGLTISGTTGKFIFIPSLDGSATIKVTMTWKKAELLTAPSVG